MSTGATNGIGAEAGAENTDAERSVSARPPGLVRGSLLSLLAAGVLLLLLEGLSSFTLAALDPGAPEDEAAYFAYDAELGWVARPNLAIHNLWGPGASLRTNAQGFRAPTDAAPQPAPDHVRAICSGDSFTFGQGVGDESPWCHRLSELSPGLETLNLGLPGYGVDQALLRYRRHAGELAHSIHLFAFIADNFTRMRRRVQHGYGKPILRLEGDSLVVANTPVPRMWPAISRTLTRFADRLDTVALGLRLLRAAGLAENIDEMAVEREVMEALADRALREVRDVTRRNGGSPVFVYLPNEFDLERNRSWRRYVLEAAARLNVPLIDLTEPLRALPPARRETFFIPWSEPAGGHYTDAGNAWVADELLRELAAIPEVAERLP